MANDGRGRGGMTKYRPITRSAMWGENIVVKIGKKGKEVVEAPIRLSETRCH